MATPNPRTVGRVRRWKRHLRLQELGYPSYSAYLRSPHWKAKRLEYAGSDQPQDCMCGETEGLQLHHMTYERVGAEEVTDLTPLCSTCHSMVHTLEARGDMGLDFSGFVNEQRAERRRAEVEAKRLQVKVDALSDVAFVENIRRDWQKIRAGRDGRLFQHRVKQELKRLEQRLYVDSQFV